MTGGRGGTRVLVTGAGGFVGPHLLDALRRIGGGDVELIATAKDGALHRKLGRLAALDVCDAAAVGAAIARWRPTHVVNLAGFAAPAAAAAAPDAAWAVHLHGARNLARAILAHAPACWLFQISSGLVYGASARSGEPVDERTMLAPLDEYSASKAAADLALGALVPAGLKCVRFRPFNHTGRGQSEDFVIPAFAMQVARIEADLAPRSSRSAISTPSATFSMSPTSSTPTLWRSTRPTSSSRAKSSTSPPDAPAASATY